MKIAPKLGLTRQHFTRWGLTGILALGGLGLHELGLLGGVELALYDGWMRWQAPTQVDPRFLVVEITEADLQLAGQPTIPDAMLVEAVELLAAADPASIGIDLIRDLPVPDLTNPGAAVDLPSALRAYPQTVVICTLGEEQAGTAPPLGIPRVGFADVVVDADGLIRRNLLGVSAAPGSPCPAQFSLGNQLAAGYLAQQGIDPPQVQDGQMEWGAARLPRLGSRPYYPIDARGYQLLLRYGGGAEQVSLNQVLRAEVSPQQIQGRIVLIGATAPSLRDLFATPISGRAGSAELLPGVQLHVHMAGQLIDLALGNADPIQQLPPWQERLWILIWAGVGSLIALRADSWRHLLWGWGGSLIGLGAITASSLALSWWIPMGGSLLGIVLPGLLRLRGSEELLLGRYRILRPLGQGGFGLVFLAADQERQQLCVIKKLILEGVDPWVLETYKDLFRREGEIMRQVQHDRIPQLYGSHYFEQEETFYIVQEYIAGIPLDQEIATTAPWPEVQIRDFLGQMLAILAFIHQRQILHRDIKPSNIIRRASDGQWVLIDFGIGRQAFTPDDRTTTAIGSQGYVAPEQEQGKAVPASDLYALGVVTIEAATGKRFASLRHLPAPQHRVPLAQSFATAESTADPVPSTAPLSLNTQPLGTQPLNTAPLPPKADVVPAARSRPWRQAAPQLSDPLLALIDSFVDPDVSHRPASATAALDALTGLSG